MLATHEAKTCPQTPWLTLKQGKSITSPFRLRDTPLPRRLKRAISCSAQYTSAGNHWRRFHSFFRVFRPRPPTSQPTLVAFFDTQPALPLYGLRFEPRAQAVHFSDLFQHRHRRNPREIEIYSDGFEGFSMCFPAIHSRQASNASLPLSDTTVEISIGWRKPIAFSRSQRMVDATMKLLAKYPEKREQIKHS
jgi:hypothetical protein